jgi:hypothetical protein
MSATLGYFLSLSVILGMGAAAAPVATQAPQQERRLYYGDLHLHTGYSFDAYLTGTRTVPDDAYRFALGETVTIAGVAYKRTSAPLDFLAVTDHAEWMNVPDAWQSPDSPPFLNELYRKFSTAMKESFQAYLQLNWPSSPELPKGADMAAVTRSAWQRQVEAANRYYRPGEFTTLLGYEWTSETVVAADDVLAMHRNVIFSGSHPPAPFTSIDSRRPEALWKFLDQCRNEGHDVLAIAGHPYRSHGKAFNGVDSEGRPIDARYATARAANEPLLEITQGGGDSDADPELSPADEFAGFDRSSQRIKSSANLPPEPGSFARYALSQGMRIAQSNGVNPYRFGFVGSSDFHNGRSESAEAVEGRRSSGSLTAVWAESNTREAIFAALRRRETFATSGTRLQLRFFGGWDYDRALLNNRDWLQTAYRDGVSMGSDLPARSGSQRAPVFIARADKDADGANLDRLQIVKVWLDGDRHAEKIYDVAVSDGRTIDRTTGRAPAAVGNTVNLAAATYTNTIGAPMLVAVWRDPDFDPTQPAAYYLRALEIPTPRMTTFSAHSKNTPLSQDWPSTIQERGWASPIWYTPSAAESLRTTRVLGR